MKKSVLYAVCIVFFLLGTTPAFAQSASYWFEKGKTAEAEMKYQTAINAYSKAITFSPAFAGPYLNRAKLTFRFHPTECVSALEDLNMAINLEADNAEAYYRRAHVNFYMINNEKGKKDMELAAALGHGGAREFLNPEASSSSTGARYISLAISGEPAVVHFDLDKAEIKKPFAQLLDAIGSTLSQDLPAVSVFIAGHADSTGSEEYNEALSLRRAEAVQSYLSNNAGISSDRMILRAYGESKPAASNKSKEGRAKNRRVDLIGIKK